MRRYYAFSGLSTRSEYWGVQILSGFALFFAALLLSLMMHAGLPEFLSEPMIFLLFAVYFWVLAATGARRCRDADINPWWVLAFAVPFVNFVLWIVLGVLKTDPRNVPDTQSKS